jgi:uncharacterized protein involved in exopolysaccharide biosynthesis
MSPFVNPAWYATQAADLTAELDARKAALAQAQDSLDQAVSLRGTTGSVNLLVSGSGTPQDVIARMQADADAVQTQIDDLADLARRNDIQPGVLRQQG